jgi:hypothetical protein
MNYTGEIKAPLAIIYNLRLSCGDSCCSWSEVSVETPSGEKLEDFSTIESAILYCKKEGWVYSIEYTE